MEGENILCLANVIAIYKADTGTEILKRDGSVTHTVFTPPTLKKRFEALQKESAIKRVDIRKQRETP